MDFIYGVLWRDREMAVCEIKRFFFIKRLIKTEERIKRRKCPMPLKKKGVVI